MHYTYVASWSVTDGVAPPTGADTIELVSSASVRCVLTRDPDHLLEPVDRSRALAEGIMRGVIGRSVGDLHAFVESHLSDVVAKREKRGRGAVLVFVANGDVEADIDEQRPPERNGYIVCMDAIDKPGIIRRHQAEVTAIKAALALESASATGFRPLVSDVYLTRDDGVTVYCFTLGGSARASVIPSLKGDGIKRVNARYRALLTTPELETVRRLSALQADAEGDRLRQFLFGWAALEVFINKAFNANKRDCEAHLNAGEHPAVRGHALSQASAGRPGDASSLSGKFAAIAALVLPDAAEDEAVADQARFRELAKARNDFQHGNVIADADLPVDHAVSLLSKYLAAYIGRYT